MSEKEMEQAFEECWARLIKCSQFGTMLKMEDVLMVTKQAHKNGIQWERERYKDGLELCRNGMMAIEKLQAQLAEAEKGITCVCTCWGPNCYGCQYKEKYKGGE